ncbi:peptidase M3, partial [Vibrio cholerae]|nr:peptidase M3 [Vibrio cholerae]
IVNLTGEGFNARYLADACNLTPDEAWQKQQHKMAQLATREQTKPASLNAQIRVIDGATELASNRDSDEEMCRQFEAYIAKHYGC